MSAPPFMPLFVGDYLADTTHLTCTEHGAYMLLLMSLWRNGGSLPSDDKTLARHARCTKGQWDRMRPVLIGFFDISDATISHGRLTAELTRHSTAVEQQRERSSNGGKAKALKNRKLTPAVGTEKSCQPEPEPQTEETNVPSVIAAKPLRAAKRCPEGWMPRPDDFAIGESEGLSPGEITGELAKFRDHTFGTARADWSATFRNWLREAARRSKPKAHNVRPDKLTARHENYAASWAGAEQAAGILAARRSL